MNANAVPVLELFEKKMSLEVPLFQRQYVWNELQQWQPLWEDISIKFSQALQGRKDAPVHFLGAMVLDQKQTPTTHVEKRQVIDGQQRLTTLQIFLAAFRDYCKEYSLDEIAKECSTFTRNSGMMANKDVDCYKVWPTQLDRPQFTDVMDTGSLEALLLKYPLIRLKYQRKPAPRPRMVEAYLFFYKNLREYFEAQKAEPQYADVQLQDRVEECLSSLRNALRVVVIDLDKDDDAQVIFETLNARGEPLLPADLLRNYIFLRVARERKDPEQLYKQYWEEFDDLFWREEIRQGRLSRPRSDLFMQHFLASRQAAEIPVKNLFVEYKHWITSDKPFLSVEDELSALARQRQDFRWLIEPSQTHPTYRLALFLQVFDMSTLFPLLLRITEAAPSELEWLRITEILEAYVLRRAVCGLTNKNFNSVFLALTRLLRSEQVSAERITAFLSSSSGESSVWPSDDLFRVGWLEGNAYAALPGLRLVHVLKRLNEKLMESKSEDFTIHSPMTVEHLMPQSWQENWPLRNGRSGLTFKETFDVEQDDERLKPTKIREKAIQTVGNLTLLTGPLNASVSNGSWDVKRPGIVKSSVLPLNQQLNNFDVWDESAIAKRGGELLKLAISLWPGPSR